MMSALKRAWLVLPLVFAACSGQHEPPGKVTDAERPAQEVATRAAASHTAAADRGRAGSKQILFGDLHTHTTFSQDAFSISLPLLGGEGAHPPADACDYARFCSSLDFWSINDHAEGVTPLHWEETRESVRACNAAASDPANPDLVTFLGWEWTQVGTSAASHYGHKNVVLRETADDRVPRRAIAAPREEFGKIPIGPAQRVLMPLADWENRQRYWDFFTLYEEMGAVPACEAGLDTRELPADCHETAADPQELYEKLDQWGVDALVIPHGTTWGLSTPPGTTLRQQLSAEQHDPTRQVAFEIYSGHGNSEEYREWPDLLSQECPAPRDDYLACCWQAGEIIRSRCEEPASSSCEDKVALARRYYVEAGVGGHNTIPGAQVEDWLDCGQCRDCFMPAMDLRPGMSGQAALAMTNLEDGARYRFGFIGSSDTHRARPGNGYKETDPDRTIDSIIKVGALGGSGEVAPDPVPIVLDDLPIAARRFTERQASFYVTGGLVAVHSEGRDRSAVYDALERREVYGTSGDRILLWFDLMNPVVGSAPMGSEAVVGDAPRFRVSAVGSFEQQPGCPDSVHAALDPDRIESVCGGECYHPGDRRRRIEAIEVVRIRAQTRADESLEELIEDPWLSHGCDGHAEGCDFEFEDPEFADLGREVVYYVRALQEPTPAINGDPLRCARDERGACIEARPCESTTSDDECLSEIRERAWSSPIFVTAEPDAL
jgi:hypothetical protein